MIEKITIADQQAQIAAADEQVEPPLALGLHDAEQDRIGGNQTPDVFGDSEHKGSGFRGQGSEEERSFVSLFHAIPDPWPLSPPIGPFLSSIA